MIVFYPIKPVYIDRILSGEKKYELRKRLPKNSVEYVFLYATTPVCRVVGYAKVGAVYRECKTKLWERVYQSAGIEKTDYFDYFDGNDQACAIELETVYKYRDPFHPKDISSDFTVPQSFRYIEQDTFDRVNVRESALV